jgi:hypothetical protein
VLILKFKYRPEPQRATEEMQRKYWWCFTGRVFGFFEGGLLIKDVVELLI